MYDALQVGQALVTKTAAFNSTGIDLGIGTPRRGLRMQLAYSAASTSAGTGAATWQVTESSDNSTFTGPMQTTESSLVLGTTALSGEIFIPVVTKKRYVRLELVSISGTTASVTYASNLTLSEAG